MKSASYVRIAELSKLSGIPVPKIRAYVKMGVLPRPIKSAKTVAYYTQDHLKTLKLIKEMEAENISPAFLRKMIDSIVNFKRKTNQSNATMRVGNKLLGSGIILKKIVDSVADTEGRSDLVHVNIVQILKSSIIDACIPIFREKGYERTTIADISKAAGIGRNTFYLYFKNKKELFIECLSALFSEWKGEQAKRPPEGLLLQIKKMFEAFYKVYPRWGDMMALFRASAVQFPSDFSDRLEQTLTARTEVIASDVKAAIERREIREINPDLLAMMIAGVSELVCYYLCRGRFRDIGIEEVAEQMVDIWTRGIRRE
jgi:AcrR family transcriptional regulator